MFHPNLLSILHRSKRAASKLELLFFHLKVYWIKLNNYNIEKKLRIAVLYSFEFVIVNVKRTFVNIAIGILMIKWTFVNILTTFVHFMDIFVSTVSPKS